MTDKDKTHLSQLRINKIRWRGSVNQTEAKEVQRTWDIINVINFWRICLSQGKGMGETKNKFSKIIQVFQKGN